MNFTFSMRPFVSYAQLHLVEPRSLFTVTIHRPAWCSMGVTRFISRCSKQGLWWLVNLHTTSEPLSFSSHPLLHLLYVLVKWLVGDLFVDGKVIHRPQYRFTERQQNTRIRPRPRHDSRRETMQVQRGQTRASDQLSPASQSGASGDFNASRGRAWWFRRIE